jgi:ribulose-phosphate 3-epimerase
VRKVKISASIIAGDLTNLREVIKELEDAQIDSIHVDTMDGHFFDYIGLGHHIIEALKRITDLPIEIHLAVREPEKFVEQFVKIGADLISVQLETCTFPLRILRRIKAARIRSGVALLPSTSFDQVRPLLNYLDQILLLSNNDSAFFSWDDSDFLPETFDRIMKISEIVQDRNVDIAVDGGIKLDIIERIVKAGANVLIMGRSIFAGSIRENVEKVKTIIKNASA